MSGRRFRPHRRAPARRADPRGHIGRGSSDRSLLYRAHQDRWWLCRPCRVCGGVELPLLARPGRVDLKCELRRIDVSLGERSCPGCETRYHRTRACGRPTVWYDTVLLDWVVQLPWSGPGAGAILPLEIRWFDAPQATIYRAAGDLAFSGDAFEQQPDD